MKPDTVLSGLAAEIFALEGLVLKLMEDDAADVEDDDLFATLVTMERLRERFKQCQEAIATMVAYRMGDDVQVVPGGTLERKMGSKRKSWNHNALKSVVTEKVMQRAMDPETGELMAPTSQLIMEALDTAGIQYWKVNALKPLGVSVAHYCEETTGDPKIVIRLSNPHQSESDGVWGKYDEDDD